MRFIDNVLYSVMYFGGFLIAALVTITTVPALLFSWTPLGVAWMLVIWGGYLLAVGNHRRRRLRRPE